PTSASQYYRYVSAQPGPHGELVNSRIRYHIQALGTDLYDGNVFIVEEATPTPTFTPSPTQTPTFTPSATPSKTPTPTTTPTPSPTPSPSRTPTLTPTPSPSTTPTPTPTSSPTITPTPSTGSIQGVVFEDQNNDGVKGKDEPGVPGVEITLSNNQFFLSSWSQFQRTTLTNEQGFFEFSDIPPATYELYYELPAELIFSGQTVQSVIVQANTVVQAPPFSCVIATAKLYLPYISGR
ncbi:MAG: hypothetical protein GXP38_14365, partial [Chloroflexi bacterium]|nr:hypothetical protein [Chloroflexota bacterium]